MARFQPFRAEVPRAAEGKRTATTERWRLMASPSCWMGSEPQTQAPRSEEIVMRESEGVDDLLGLEVDDPPQVDPREEGELGLSLGVCASPLTPVLGVRGSLVLGEIEAVDPSRVAAFRTTEGVKETGRVTSHEVEMRETAHEAAPRASSGMPREQGLEAPSARIARSHSP
jgi:hypothetical protein